MNTKMIVATLALLFNGNLSTVQRIEAKEDENASHASCDSLRVTKRTRLLSMGDNYLMSPYKFIDLNNSWSNR